MSRRTKPAPVVMHVLEATRRTNEFAPDKITAVVSIESDDFTVKPGDVLVIERAQKNP